MKEKWGLHYISYFGSETEMMGVYRDGSNVHLQSMFGAKIRKMW